MYCGTIYWTPKVFLLVGRLIVKTKEKILKPSPGGRYGHLSVRLYNESRFKDFLVHRLVLSTFVGPCPAGMQCRHSPDRDPTNNHLSNLLWGTPKQNMDDRERHGRHDKGSQSVKAKLTEADIPVIKDKIKLQSMNSVAVEYKVNVATIRDIRDGFTWKHVV